MRRHRVRIGLAALLAVLAGACGSSGGGTSSADEPDPSGVLRVGTDMTRATYSFDPTKLGTGIYTDTTMVLAPLLTRASGGAIVPYLAESATIVDGRTITVTLRPNLKFSDGTPLDSAAVKATFERNLASNNSAGLQIADMKFVSSISIESTTKFTIHLSEPSAAVIYVMLAGIEFAPMSPASFASGVDLGTHAVGAGPMMITSWEAGTKITFAKNPHFWDAANVKLSGMELINVTPAAALNGLRANQVDWVKAPTIDELSGLASPLVSDVVSTTIPAGINLCPNKAPLSDLRVRQAIAYAVDRDAFNQVILGGRSEPAWDLWPASSPFHTKSLDNDFKRDVAKAKKLLADAGYPNGIKFTMMTTPSAVRPVELLQAQLREAGIQVEVVVSSNAGVDYFQLAKTDSLYTNNRPGIEKVSRFFLSTSFANACKFPMPKVDALYPKLAALPLESKEAIELWGQVQQLIAEEYLQMVHLVFLADATAYNSSRIGKLVPYYDQLGTRVPSAVGTYIKK